MELSDKIPGCLHFSWKEALWLPKWNRASNESDGLTEEIKQSLVNTFQWMEKVREFLGPVTVHVALRPEEYNKLVGGASKSMHRIGRAVDFHISGMTCDTAREKLKEKLEEWKLRMEDNGQGSSWVHLDDREPGPAGRFFKP